MEFFHDSRNILCIVMALITVVCAVMFLAFRSYQDKREDEGAKLRKAIPILNTCCLIATSFLSLILLYKSADDIDPEGLLSLLLIPYLAFVFLAMLVLSSWLLVLMVLEVYISDKGKVTAFSFLLTVIGSAFWLIGFIETPFEAIVVVAAKTVTCLCEIYYIENSPHGKDYPGQQVFYNPFNKDNDKAE